MIRCPKCEADNEENFNFCKLCGERLKSIYKFCPECSEKNRENANFCKNCGTSFETFGSGKETQDKTDIPAGIFIDSSNQMNSLNLTPAESLMILDHGKYSHRTSVIKLLKVTLIDLVFKNVFKLDIQEVEEKGKKIKKIYLDEGKNFNMPLKPHEEIFRKYLPSRADSNRFRILQGYVLRNALRYDYAKKKLLKPLSSNGFFAMKKGFWGKTCSLSDKGVETRQIINQLKNDGKNLEKWLKTDPERAKAYLLIGGSNIFLTDKRNFKWFKNNSGRISTLFSSERVRTNTSDFFDYDWYSTFMWDSENVDIGNINGIFSDFNMSDIFDSIDSHDFDFGFNISESDGGIFDSGFGGGFDSGGFDGGGFDGGGGDGGGGGGD